MVNHVAPREQLEFATLSIAERLAKMPRMGLLLAKRAVNHIEDLRGKRTGMEAVFHMHHFAHAHNDLTSTDHLAGYDAKAMANSQRPEDDSSKQ